MADVTASIVINFTPGGADDSGAVLQAEIDSRDDGYNSGATSFSPGQVAYYLLYMSSNVALVSQLASAGRIEGVTTEQIQKTERLSFAGASDASTQYPISGSYTTKWLGRTPSATLVKVNDTTFQLRDSVGAAQEDVGVLHITYTTTHLVYRLAGLPAALNGETTYDVVILVTGTAS